MTWIIPSSIRSAYVLASECSTSESEPRLNGSDFGTVLHAFVSGKVTLRPASWRGWKSRPWSRALFGAAISDDSTPSRFAEWWTSSLRDSPVNRIQSPGSNAGTSTSEVTAKTGAGRSRNSCESWPSVAPPWSSSKTFLPGFEKDGFDQSAKNYADWVTRSKSRSSLLRSRLERVIEGSGCSSWPTPQANDSEKRGQVAFSRDNQTCLPSQVTTWPTPAARDHKSGKASQETSERDSRPLNEVATQWGTPQAHVRSHAPREVDHGVQLSNQVSEFSPPAPAPTGEPSPNTSGRRLNAAFVAWLMGVPWWWTRAERINFAAAEMDAYRSALLWRLSNFFDG